MTVYVRKVSKGVYRYKTSSVKAKTRTKKLREVDRKIKLLLALLNRP